MRPVVWIFATLAIAIVCGDTAEAQRFGRGRPQYAENIPYDGEFSFTFVRLRFEPGGYGCRSGSRECWDHDYPRAETNFARILDEVALIDPYLGGSNIIGVGDPELFNYPIGYVSEPGFLNVTEEEATNLRNYLLKGGFLIFDDFAGGGQLFNFESQVQLILPGAEVVPLDASHPIFDSFFRIESLDFPHPYYGVQAEFLGVYEDNDPEKRLLLIANYNNDIGESWEYSGTGLIPIDLTNNAYKLGVNYIIYSMTH